MNVGQPLDASAERRHGAPSRCKHDTWNSPEWIARHSAMAPGERIELAISISRVALQFAAARRVAPDDG
jgi:hypothetical protein